MVASLERENEGLKQTIEQFKKDTKRNKSQVNELELKLSEAKEVCRQKTEEADHVQNILKTKVSPIFAESCKFCKMQALSERNCFDIDAQFLNEICQKGIVVKEKLRIVRKFN